MARPKPFKPSPQTTKRYSDGTGRLLWETEAEYALYLQYSALPESTGLVERSLSLLETDGWSQSEIETIAGKNDWVDRAKAFDKYWKPKAALVSEARIETAEIINSELGELAGRLMMARLQKEPHRIKTSELIAIVKLAPVINRSESHSTVVKE